MCFAQPSFSIFEWYEKGQLGISRFKFKCLFLFITTAMEITVLGTESPPTFSDAPAGPYKMQKEVVLTQIYDDL